MRGRALAAFVALCGVTGCPAKPAPQWGPDMSEAPPDLTPMMEPPPIDMAVGPDMACPVGPEICDNKCDDDGNGFIDGQDPACTGGQVLVTIAVNPAVKSPLYRMALWPMPALLVLADPYIVDPPTMSTFKRGFSPTVYLGVEGGTRQLSRLALDGGVMTNTLDFPIRDLCVFNGELVIVESRGTMAADSTIHRFKADGKTEITPALHIDGTASACATDNVNLYVSRWDGPSPSEIVVVSAAELTAGMLNAVPTVLPLPAGIADGCSSCDRLIDFAYVPQTKLFLGLFADGGFGATSDPGLDSQFVTMFALDGGVTPPIDAGNYHGVGEFIP